MRTRNWASIIKRRRRGGIELWPDRILVGNGARDIMLTVYWDDEPDVIGITSFADRSILRKELSKRFPGVQCNWFGAWCFVPERGWPDQELVNTVTSNGDGPWQEWPRADVTKTPEPTEWRPCQFCGRMIVAGWRFPRYKAHADVACHDHIHTLLA